MNDVVPNIPGSELSQAPKPNFFLPLVVVAALLVLIGIGVRLWKDQVYGPIIPGKTLAKLKLGMRENDIEQLLGKPSEVSTGGRTTEFIYKRFGNVGKVTIKIDRESGFHEFVDESFHPEIVPSEE